MAVLTERLQQLHNMVHGLVSQRAIVLDLAGCLSLETRVPERLHLFSPLPLCSSARLSASLARSC